MSEGGAGFCFAHILRTTAGFAGSIWICRYYAIVRKNFVDLVPKAVMALLVNHAKDNVQSELVRNLYREELFDDLLRETDDITKRRRNAMEMQALLQRASEIINEVRDFKV